MGCANTPGSSQARSRSNVWNPPSETINQIRSTASFQVIAYVQELTMYSSLQVTYNDIDPIVNLSTNIKFNLRLFDILFLHSNPIHAVLFVFSPRVKES